MATKITEKLIKKIMQASPEPGEAAVQFLADKIRMIQVIDDLVVQHDYERRLLEKKYKDDRATLDAAKLVIQNQCEHWDTTYQGDPAGGSDSSTVCNICGKYLE